MLCRGSTAQLQKIEFPWPQLTVIAETSRKQDEVRFVDNCLEMIVMLASWKGWIGEIEFCTYYITTSTISGRCQDTVIQVSYEGDFFYIRHRWITIRDQAVTCPTILMSVSLYTWFSKYILKSCPRSHVASGISIA